MSHGTLLIKGVPHLCLVAGSLFWQNEMKVLSMSIITSLLSPTKSESSAAELNNVNESAKGDTRSQKPGHEDAELCLNSKEKKSFKCDHI